MIPYWVTSEVGVLKNELRLQKNDLRIIVSRVEIIFKSGVEKIGTQNTTAYTVCRQLKMEFKVIKVTSDAKFLYLSLEDGVIIKYLNFWLRDNCLCKECYNSDTFQRIVDTFDIPEEIEPKKSISDGGTIEIIWSDGHVSTYPLTWLKEHTRKTHEDDLSSANLPDKIYWAKNEISQILPSVDFKDVLNKTSKELYNNIYKYGFTFINNVPATSEETEKLCNSIGYIRHTHYGGFWDFTSDLSMKDTAYSDIEIPSHTDGTYWEYTPFLQLFHLLYHDGQGGDTTLVDAFKCAHDFAKEHPQEYQFLSKLKVQCHSLGDVLLTQSKPIFNHAPSGELLQVSWNNSDRSTNCNLEIEEQIKFYDAIRKWNKVIHRPQNILTYRLRPGQALIFDNWRVLHARIGKFTGKRRMCGAYFDREDFLSTLKIQNATDRAMLFNCS